KEKTKEYSDYQQIYQRKLAESKEKFQQLQLLKGYLGCKKCGKTYNCLPIDANCAKKWLKDSNHLDNCQCLAENAQESYLLFTNSLKKDKKRLEKECKCEERIKGAGKTGKIKNRLEIKEKVLCGKCLEKNKEKMPPLRKAEFNRYRK
ncbi:17892_t:CDS:2, partial [Gigaspora margarita]